MPPAQQQQQQQQPFRQQHGRVFNFAAGPACLPAAVLEQAQAELLNWRGSGVSVMEMSHRGKEFTSILEQAVADLRELLAIPANYQVLRQLAHPAGLPTSPRHAVHTAGAPLGGQGCPVHSSLGTP